MATNPAYKHLAYRRAILRHMANLILDRFVGAGGREPTQTIICEDVFYEDREIPTVDILEYVEELQEQEQSLKLEMNRFEFRRRDDNEQLGQPTIEEASLLAAAQEEEESTDSGAN